MKQANSRGWTPSATPRWNSLGFTLLEVLIAFAILVSALTLVAAGFSRHVAALQALGNSVEAYRTADRSMIRELIRREAGAELPEDLPGPIAASFTLTPVELEAEPFKDEIVDRASALASWRSGSVEMVGAFPRPEQQDES